MPVYTMDIVEKHERSIWKESKWKVRLNQDPHQLMASICRSKNSKRDQWNQLLLVYMIENRCLFY